MYLCFLRDRHTIVQLWPKKAIFRPEEYEDCSVLTNLSFYSEILLTFMFTFYFRIEKLEEKEDFYNDDSAEFRRQQHLTVSQLSIYER